MGDNGYVIIINVNDEQITKLYIFSFLKLFIIKIYFVKHRCWGGVLVATRTLYWVPEHAGTLWSWDDYDSIFVELLELGQKFTIFLYRLAS